MKTRIEQEEEFSTETIFDRWRARSAINGKGVYTDLGGAFISPSVWAAMTDSNLHSVDMIELLEGSGRRIAELVRLESARVVPGASAAIALPAPALLTPTSQK